MLPPFFPSMLSAVPPALYVSIIVAVPIFVNENAPFCPESGQNGAF